MTARFFRNQRKRAVIDRADKNLVGIAQICQNPEDLARIKDLPAFSGIRRPKSLRF
jgi:hypothetical protein